MKYVFHVTQLSKIHNNLVIDVSENVCHNVLMQFLEFFVHLDPHDVQVIVRRVVVYEEVSLENVKSFDDVSSHRL